MQKTLKELREENRYTLRAVAENTGIPYGSYVGYEYGYRKIPLKQAQKIAQFYGIDTGDIKVLK